MELVCVGDEEYTVMIKFYGDTMIRTVLDKDGKIMEMVDDFWEMEYPNPLSHEYTYREKSRYQFYFLVQHLKHFEYTVEEAHCNLSTMTELSEKKYTSEAWALHLEQYSVESSSAVISEKNKVEFNKGLKRKGKESLIKTKNKRIKKKK